MLRDDSKPDADSELRNAESVFRRKEVKLKTLFDLVVTDYRDNEQASLSTLLVNLKHLEPVFASRSAERVKAYEVEAYKSARKAEGAANATINLELATLRRAYNLGLKRGLVKSKPAISLFAIGKKNRRTGFFEPEDVEKLMPHLKHYQKQCLRFAYHSGWREGEIFKLQWEVNFNRENASLRIWDSKNSDGRYLPLKDEDGNRTECGEVIREQFLSRPEGCVWIFHYEGRQLKRKTFNNHWHDACKAAGVDRHFHDLRRTAVRHLTRAGVPRVIAKEITGHRSDNVYERYDIVDESDIRNAISRVSAYTRKRTKPKEEKSSRIYGTLNSTCVPDESIETQQNQVDGGERGIRTLGAVLPAHTISKRALISNLLKSLVNFVARLWKR